MCAEVTLAQGVNCGCAKNDDEIREQVLLNVLNQVVSNESDGYLDDNNNDESGKHLHLGEVGERKGA